MFCSNCGSKLPDGSKHCTFCGTAVAPAQPSHQAPTQAVPSYPQTPSYDPAPSYIPPQMPEYDLGPKIPENYVDRDRVRKGKFLRAHADGTTKVLGIVAWVLAIAFAVVIFLAGNTTLNGPIYDIPAIQAALELEGMDAVEEFEEMRSDAIWELQSLLFRGGLPRQVERQLDDTLELLEEEFSIRSILNAVILVERNSQNSTGAVSVGAITIVEDVLLRVVINVFYVLAGIFLLIGILFMAGGWIWPAMILATLQALSLSGVVYAALIAVLGIALIVILSRITKAYRDFKSGF